MTKLLAIVAFVFASFVAIAATSSSASAASCFDGKPAQVDDVKTMTIMPCPTKNQAYYVEGVQGQNQLIEHGLVALQGKAGKGCLWIKQVKKNNGSYKLFGKKVDTDLVALPGAGVMRTDGKVAFVSQLTIVGLEMKPGACGGNTVAKSVAEIIAMKR